MEQNGLTLEDLSSQTGVEQRTLRSWVADGLLSPPFRPGRGALYPIGNVARALAVRALKENHGLQLADIRKEFLVADDDQIAVWASEVPAAGSPRSSARDYLSDVRAHRDQPAPVISKQQASLTQSAALPEDAHPQRSLFPKGKGLSPRVPPPTAPMQAPQFDDDATTPKLRRRLATKSTSEEGAGLEGLLSRLEATVEARPTRRSRGEDWYRIPITPDLELSVRGGLPPKDRATLERIADLIRTILTGG